jgi:hypothetical protein
MTIVEDNDKNPLSFVFIDESGVLHNDPNQPFFAIGALIVEDTSELVQQLMILRRQAVAATGNKWRTFEFKFKEITHQSRPFYEKLIDLVDFFHPQLCMAVVDKSVDKTGYSKRYRFAWDAYVQIAKLVIEKAVNHQAECVVIADFVQKPRISHAYLEPLLKSLPQVRNATMLESHASLMIQLTDVLTGCIVYQHRMKRCPEEVRNSAKLKVSNYMIGKLGLHTQAKDSASKESFPIDFWHFTL